MKSKVMKKAAGRKVSEYGGKETYKSKSAMKKHEAKESPAMEKKEKKMKSGGRVTRKMSGGDLLGTLSPLAGIVSGKGLFGTLAKSGAGLGLLGAAAALREDAKKKRSPATTAGAKKAGGVVKKKAGGTMTMRGAGAATKGKKFYRNG